jgi:hypothetical protein
MTSLRRILLIGTPALMLAAGASLHAASAPPRLVKCGQPATRMAAFLQKVGLAARVKPCEAASPGPGSLGEWCTNPGHHCSGPDGAGKCTTAYDDGVWSCVCLPNGR